MNSPEELTILAISGSLRANSLNTALLAAAQKHAPTGVRVELYEGLTDLPPFNDDLDTPQTVPASVTELRSLIGDADGLLIATPEYNYSVPGVLKNALDWASRPNPGAVLDGKDVAITGASPGNFGTSRAQMALRQIFLATRSNVVVSPETLVFAAHQRFDEGGNLIDDGTVSLLRSTLEVLRAQILRNRGKRR
ncbi:NADPH-dependent FMN reductase [Streptomyces flaveolus]|uniref:NADPH-dependent FMN reductase n=1 Tax=Streptomyces flaveolus TaxID=67297 RepID=UPI00340A4ABE